MVKQMNDVKYELDNLFDKLKQSTSYKDYVNVVNKLKENDDITSLISEIKRLQKILINEKDKVVEKELDNLNLKLNSYPIYQTYLIKKEELEEELVVIKEMFDKYFKDVLKLW